MINTDLELLAPAGKWDVLERVAQAGADAVYAGGKRFNMRMLRPDFNFSDLELRRAVDYLHDQGKRLYITVNSLYYDEEMSELSDYLSYLQDINVDALIVQDLGVAGLHRKLKLNLPMHASVQMGISSSSAVNFLETLGFRRIILSKNLSLQEIHTIHQETNLAIEFFAHGDLCISHTGQCFFSSMIAGESANRGRCVKPCRWEYCLENNNTLLSPGYYLAHNDLNVYPHLLELAKAGVQSFKIEGRMRDAEYLAFLIQTYRRALDQIADKKGQYQIDNHDVQALEEKRIRNFSSASLFGPIEIDSIGIDGSREPKFPTAPLPTARLKFDDFKPYTDGPQTVPQLVVKVGNLESLHHLKNRQIGYVILGIEKMRQGNSGWSWQKMVEAINFCREFDLPLVLETPRIVMPKDIGNICNILDRMLDYSLQAIMVNDLGSLQEASLRGYNLYGGIGLNISNSEAGQLMASRSLSRLTASPELKFDNLLGLLESEQIVDVVVHGPQCGFITDFCLMRAAAGDRQRPCSVHCEQEPAFLIDELGQRYQVCSDSQCRNHVFLPLDLCLFTFLPDLAKAGTAGVRIEGQYMSAQEMSEVIEIYQEGLQQLSQGQWNSLLYQRLLQQYPHGLTSGWFVNRPI